jgi:[protein-PII] uridylyltransferase
MSQAFEKIQSFAETSPSYLREELVPLEIGTDVASEVRDYIQACRERIYQRMDEGIPSTRLVQLLSLMMDRLVTELYRHGFEESQVLGAPTSPMALFAQGGYGRAELNIFSDIDLLIIYQGKSSKVLEPIVNKMLYPLWDAKLEVGYSIRTLEECAGAMDKDVRVMSSILDARYLAGDRDLARKFFHFLEGKTSTTRAMKHFIRAKLQENEERLKRFGTSVYVIEPNLKESEGGLRDWHTLRYFARLSTKSSQMDDWIRSDLITNEEAELIRRAVEFLLEVRNRLHRLAGKPDDQLGFAFQKTLAQSLGFETGGGKLEAEKFMQTYYMHAATLYRLRCEVTRRILQPPRSIWSQLKNRFRPTLGEFFLNVNGKILPKGFRRVETHPVEIVRAFALAQKKQIEIDDGFKAWISRHLNLIDEAYRKDPEVTELMREMFADVPGIGRTLNEMHDCRLLGVLLPEFGEILHQTQHDAYHVYTVDTHSIKAVQELSLLEHGDYDEEFPVFKKALGEIQSSIGLVLGTLCHDIGKGKGGSHSEVGAELAQRIMQRMGCGETERATVEFLVLSHLMMPHLSQRRDLEDVNLINQFARTMGDLERLNLLFVLTWADIRAVGPDVWTPWKGDLLIQLYEKTRDVLERGEFTPERAREIMVAVKKSILKITPRHFDEAQLKLYLETMPPRYFLAFRPEEILRHFEWIAASPDKKFIFHQVPNNRGNYNEVFLRTVNSPRLFEQVTGALAANQVNILALEQFFDKKGEALLLLKVTDRQNRLLFEARRFETVKMDLQEVIYGKLPVEEYYVRKGEPGLYQSRGTHKAPSVAIDQDVSPYYTVIDIYADDRIGLLYDLASVMRKLNLFVEVSKISTKVDQVSDAFYVKDIFGHKINDRTKIKTVKASILEVLEHPPQG